jgi:hypothetical protein
VALLASLIGVVGWYEPIMVAAAATSARWQIDHRPLRQVV